MPVAVFNSALKPLETGLNRLLPPLTRWSTCDHKTLPREVRIDATARTGAKRSPVTLQARGPRRALGLSFLHRPKTHLKGACAVATFQSGGLR